MKLVVVDALNGTKVKCQNFLVFSLTGFLFCKKYLTASESQNPAV